MEVRKLIEYQAPEGWRGAIIVPLIYTTAAAGAGSLAGLGQRYIDRFF